MLEHLTRYRLTFQEVLGALFFDGADPQKTLNELKAKGLITAQSGFGGNRKAYLPTAAAAAVLHVGRRRADALGSEALPTNLAILSFCVLCCRARIRLLEDELHELLGVTPPGRYHAAERGARATCVYELYVPGDSTPDRDIVKRTVTHVSKVAEIAELQPWLRHRMYVHAILVESDQRRAEIDAALDEAVVDHRPLSEVGAVEVTCVSGRAQIEEALRALVEEAQVV